MVDGLVARRIVVDIIIEKNAELNCKFLVFPTPPHPKDFDIKFFEVMQALKYPLVIGPMP